MLKSRHKYTKESFLINFFKNITPWLIKRNEFINWNRIYSTVEKNNSYIKDLDNYNTNDLTKLKEQIKNTILSLDNPNEFIQTLFTFLGNTREFYVSDMDNIIFKDYSKEIIWWDDDKAQQIASAILDIWFSNILNTENKSDYLLGLLVWFESDKRKNKWWTEFVNYMRPLLESIINNFDWLELVEEYKIIYDGENTTQDKTVDFAIMKNDKCLIWIEVNFYTNSGSKPTEIKRSYWEVNRKLNNLGIELMWVTDWFWYNKMKKSLWDAFEIHPNTYNYNMVKEDFRLDLEDFLKNK